ncbi:isoleucine--tRNA ligase [Methanoregula sp.]|uniref:isoleucine--tRNA ligase n=1 Tax=Methanoregula sp. TaxID=2052170 RepID=UPI000CC0ED09|nr:isoleucine--tRNA ligase [Methanoregula sp.]PKG33710.1 MAG: isoleucine--tRNA ligase [Methanoregula sp.]
MKEVTANFSAKEIEREVQEYWRTHDTYQAVKQQRAACKPFFFVDGPPYTTGHIHLGTAWNKIIKDSVLRYQRMNGRNVIDRAGYDMHGLPIEVKVEQALGFVSKKDIEKFGIQPFIEKCREFAVENKKLMDDQFLALGVWLDFPGAYQTVKPEYIEAAWWTLARAQERGMLERGHRVVNWCPRCETAIADAEVEYWDESDPSIFVKFPLTGKTGEFLLIWTTTPWTLPANVAVAVSKEFEYAKVLAKKDGKEEFLWIAEPLVKAVLKKGRYKDFAVVEKKKGSELVGWTYESPLKENVPLQKEIQHRVVAADFVALENTGMVHIAPGHGWDDFVLGTKEGLQIVCPVDGAGRFTDNAGEFAGQFVRDANENVLTALGDHLLAQEKVTHRYGHCWRCKTPIIFRATSQWFLKASEMRDLMLSEVEKVTWYPEWAGSARFYDWIKEARDWCISRQRYWGIPIPVWVCGKCDKYHVVGTIAELEKLSGKPLPDPHRPYVDEVTFPCSCGGTMKRVGDIFDVWFDSAVASWATLGFPKETKDFEALWPADFITEGQDQTRGWFYSQLGASTIAFGKAPYKSVCMHGFALDAEGKKMSKSLGNVVNPGDVIEKVGVDVLRLYVLSSSAPWDDLKFNWEGVGTINRAVNILWNVYRFPLPYMILDKFEPATNNGTWDDSFIRAHIRQMPDEDRFIISRINTVASLVDSATKECQLHRATREIVNFILEDLSRWYVQLVRPRMWLEGESEQKIFAYETMYYVMRRLMGLLAPFCPHLTEQVYGNLRCRNDRVSVHMLDWDAGESVLVDRELEQAVELVRSFDEAQANARQTGKRKLRWPVAEVVIVTSAQPVKDAIERLNTVCMDRANARKVSVVMGRWDRIGWHAEPVMKALGKGFGKDSFRIKGLIEAADGNAIKAAVDAGQKFSLMDGAARFEIGAEHVTFTEKLPADIFSAPMTDATVYVDVALTPDLEAEGYAREVIRRIQEMRKQLDLAVEDTISAEVSVNDKRILALLHTDQMIALVGDEVRAKAFGFCKDGTTPDVSRFASVKEWDVEGVSMTIGIAKTG